MPGISKLHFSQETTLASKSEAEKPAFNKRTIRVFISSTFRDMIEDRNALMTHCWPELRRFCRERQVELVEVDLRWGIAEEQSTRKETLKLCLDEIGACRPFFIGLLGERYGWVPGEDSFTEELMEEQPWLNETNGKSVTELEILHGALNEPEMAGRAFFYFRDPMYIETVPKEIKTDFLSSTHADAEKQTKLKNLIRNTCKVKGIPLLETYPDPQSLAHIVLEQLKVAIGTQFPIENNSDPISREARDHEAFAESRRRIYIGQPDYFDALDKHCSDDGKPLVLLGDSGCGKTALLANWIEHWRKAYPKDFIFQHYFGGTPDSAAHWKMMIRLMAEIKLWSDDQEELPKTHDEMLRNFPLWLSKARIIAEQREVHFVVVLNALNQLEDKDQGRLLGWLPDHPFTGPLRLMVSTLPGDTLDVVEKRDWSTLYIKPLKIEERRRMIVEYLARFSKKLDEPRIDRLSAEPAAANPLYLKILLDELRVTGTHEKLDEMIDEYLTAKDIPFLLGKVLARYQHDYEHDRNGLVSEALSLIWASRRGLAETELLQLLRPANLPQLPLATWSPLRAALEEMLIECGGLMNMSHSYLKESIEFKFLHNKELKDKEHLKIAEYFKDQDGFFLRKVDELPWQYIKSEAWEELWMCLNNEEYLYSAWSSNEYDVCQFWKQLEYSSNYKLADAYDNLMSSPHHAIGAAVAAGQLFIQCGLYRQALTIRKKITFSTKTLLPLIPKKEEVSQSVLSMILCEEGQAFRSAGHFLEAINSLKEAEDISRELEDYKNLLFILKEKCDILLDMGQANEVLQYIEEGIKLAKELKNNHFISGFFELRAHAYRLQGKLDEALIALKYAEELTRTSGDQRSLSQILGNRALIHYRQGHYKEAWICHEEEAIISNNLNDLNGISSAEFGKVNILKAIGEYSSAFDLLDIVYNRSQLSGNKSNIGKCFGTKAALLQDQGRYQEAIDMHSKEEVIFREISNIEGLAISLTNQAILYGERLGLFDKGIEMSKKALEYAKLLGKNDLIQKNETLLKTIFN